VNIQTRFTWHAALGVMALTAATAGLSFLLQKNLVEDRLSAARQAQVMDFAGICRQAVTGDNHLFIAGTVQRLQERPGVLYAYYLDPAGRIVVHSDPRFTFKSHGDWAAPPGALESAEAVDLGPRGQGRAVIGFSRDYQEGLLRAALLKTLRHMAAVAGVAGGLGLLFAWLLARRFTRPVRQLAEGAEKIGQGQFSARVSIPGADELAALARRFNAMADRLAVLDQLKDNFIASVSHDLRSPLAAIRTYINYMMHEDKHRTKLEESQRTCLTIILDNALRLDIYVTNVLDAAKIKAGCMQYVLRGVDLAESAGRVLDLFALPADQRKVRLVNKIPATLPPVTADPVRLDHVISNLISNALKFTPPEGHVTLEARAAGDDVELVVADTGRGIAPEELPNLFRAFYQAGAEEQSRERIKGTGLGLAIVKETVENMGGRIGVASVVKQGTRFTVTLKRHKEAGGVAS